MLITRYACILILLFISACSTGVINITASPPPTAHTSPTPTETSTQTLIPPTAVISPTFTSTNTPAIEPTESSPTSISTQILDETPLPTFDQPGVYVYGKVTLPDGTPLAGASIYYAFSAYPGNFLTSTSENGTYNGFIYIPSDETIRIWVEAEGYEIKPQSGNAIWLDHEFAWRHYKGSEGVKLEFVATGN